MTELVIPVAASADDAFESAAGAVSITTILGEVDVADEWLGWRFLNVTIPQGATIDDAKITFNFDGVARDEPDVTFFGEDTDNATAFTTDANNISGRARTTASVAWDDPQLGVNPGAGDDTRDTPDLKTIVQEIVNRAGWASGNALAILCTSTNGTAERDFGPTMWDYGEINETDGKPVPTLTINFSAAAASGVSRIPSLGPTTIPSIGDDPAWYD